MYVIPLHTAVNMSMLTSGTFVYLFVCTFDRHDLVPHIDLLRGGYSTRGFDVLDHNRHDTFHIFNSSTLHTQPQCVNLSDHNADVAVCEQSGRGRLGL